MPDGFIFSQSSLQDYVDCARRFQLRYLQHCRWPAPETADALEYERVMQGGHAFHRLLRQLYSGVSSTALEAVAAADPGLSRWWANFHAAPPQDLPDAVREAEVMLSMACVVSEAARAGPDSVATRGYRLEARYDLLAGTPGERWVIVDWKTGQRRSSRAWLAKRLQTRIYPLVLVQAGAGFNAGVQIAPHQVEMLYWFAEFPAQPERFAYSADALAVDEAYLQGLLREIEERTLLARDAVRPGGRKANGDAPASGPDEFPKTEDRRVCRYCVYRSLCWDDVQAGLLAESGDVEGPEAAPEDIDLESIAPIPF